VEQAESKEILNLQSKLQIFLWLNFIITIYFLYVILDIASYSKFPSVGGVARSGGVVREYEKKY
jgi:hypothetical protein